MAGADSGNGDGTGGVAMEPPLPNPAAASSSSKHYSLRWPDYHVALVSTFRRLREEEDFVDVTLACNGRKNFTAHKVVLSACSPYFKQLLKSNPCQHPIVILRDISEADLSSLLRFMYHGEVRIEEERLKDFMRTAETLQIRGLFGDDDEGNVSAIADTADNHEGEDSVLFGGQGSAKRHRMNGPGSLQSGGADADSPSGLVRSSSPIAAAALTPPPLPVNVGGDRWPGGLPGLRSTSMDNNTENNNKESLLSQALEKRVDTSGFASLAALHGGGGGNLHDNHNDSASDTASDRPESLVMDGGLKSEPSPVAESLHRTLTSASSLFPPGLEALYRQAGFPPAAFLGLAAASQSPGGPVGVGNGGGGGGGSASSGGSNNRDSPTSSLSGLAGLPPTHAHVGLQSHAGNPNLAGKLDMMRVRATDPRPCPKCGKIYRSAHTLRTHMEDKHTVCPGYRCVLCGTVAKSRNSLHSHMSRQHRGISTKDLPVVPMPAPFDAELASRLLAKSGVKVSPNELAARASPTAPRRSDLPKLDTNLMAMQNQAFPLPPSIPTSMAGHMGGPVGGLFGKRDSGGRDDIEDLRVPPHSAASSPPPPFGSNGSLGHLRPPMPPGGPLAGLSPKDIMALAATGAGGLGIPGGAGPGPMGSALLDTYLSMIAAAGGAGGGGGAAGAMASALQNFGRFGALAAGSDKHHANASGGGAAHNGDGDNKDVSDDEQMDQGTKPIYGSDAENDDDMSDHEGEGPTNAPVDSDPAPAAPAPPAEAAVAN